MVKQRGRPPKRKKKQNLNNSDSFAPDDTFNIDTPKICTGNSELQNINNSKHKIERDLDQNNFTIKRRGRPPKKKKTIDLNQDDILNKERLNQNNKSDASIENCYSQNFDTPNFSIENSTLQIENMEYETQEGLDQINLHTKLEGTSPIDTENFNCTDFDNDTLDETNPNFYSPDYTEITIKQENIDEYQIEVSSDQITMPKKRRGRPRKKVMNTDEANFSELTHNETIFHNNTSDINIENSILDENNPECRTEVISDRRSRRAKISKDSKTNSDDDFDDDNDLSESSDDFTISKRDRQITRKRKKRLGKRGRPKLTKIKTEIDCEYEPRRSRLLQSSETSNDKLNKSSESAKLQKSLQPIEMVKCGKCCTEIKKNQWPQHNINMHNGLAWLEGNEKPDYDNDEKLLKQILTVSLKKRKSLTCEVCKTVKRSVVGYLSHVMFCGKNDEQIKALMITCPVCKVLIKPASLEYHEKSHKIKTNDKKEKHDDVVDQELSEQRSKRKAAEKATFKIAEFTEKIKEDKDVSEKKLNIPQRSLNKIIQKPTVRRKISYLVLKKWEKDLLNNKITQCNQVGCQFSSAELEEMKDHYYMCNFKPQKNFSCKICKFQSSLESVIIKHAQDNHSLEDHEDSNISLSDAESICNETSKKIYKREIKNSSRSIAARETTDLPIQQFKFLNKNGVISNVHATTYFNAFIWTLDFELENYKLHVLEECEPIIFRLLNLKEAINYLPEDKESMLVRNKKIGIKDNSTETKWKKWELFEGENVQETPTFYTGGPVWAMAWLPIPTSMAFSEYTSEYIAISTHSNMKKEYGAGKVYSGKNIIQIWSTGVLHHKDNTLKNPELAYAITHEGGTVWSLEWCPSGCYQHENIPGFTEKASKYKRLGLLAAACSDGNIRIYSLVFPEDLPDSSINGVDPNKSGSQKKYPIYNTEPNVVLVVNIDMYDNKQQAWQAKTLSWSKEAGHSIIAAGFSNGFVALWDLSLKSTLLKYKRGNTVFLMPYRYFPTHHHAVTMVRLVSQENSRFLATAGMDRLYKFWDLEDITSPKNTFKKGIITDGAWFNNWCCAVTTSDDALNFGHNYVNCMPLRDFTYKTFNVLPTNSPSYTVSTSDFGNSLACGTLAGEVLAIFPHQLIYIRQMETMLSRKRLYSMVSSVEIVDFQNQEEKGDNTKKDCLSSSYSECKNRFGLKFCDKMSNFQKDWYHPKYKKGRHILTIDDMDKVSLERYPFMSVNKVAWNPNARSFLWLAVGYQNGFVRLIQFKTKNPDKSEYENYLIKHVENDKTQNSTDR